MTDEYENEHAHENHDAFWNELRGRVAEAEETLADAERKMADVEVGADDEMTPAEVEKIVASVTGGEVVDFAAAREKVERRERKDRLRGLTKLAAAAVVLVVAGVGIQGLFLEEGNRGEQWVLSPTRDRNYQRAVRELIDSDSPGQARILAAMRVYRNVRDGIESLKQLASDGNRISGDATTQLAQVRAFFGSNAERDLDVELASAHECIAVATDVEESLGRRRGALHAMTESIESGIAAIRQTRAASDDPLLRQSIDQQLEHLRQQLR